MAAGHSVCNHIKTSGALFIMRQLYLILNFLFKAQRSGAMAYLHNHNIYRTFLASYIVSVGQIKSFICPECCCVGHPAQIGPRMSTRNIIT